MRDYKQEFELRVGFIKDLLEKTRSKGIVYGNSGGKDCSLVSILCKAACDNTIGVIMPCQSRRNFDEDTRDALEVAEKFGIENITVNITPVKEALADAVSEFADLSGLAGANINPRIRMTTLYAVAQSRGALVAGTGNRSETYMGYFTKWGDGGCDFNPISDLTVREVYEFLEYLDCPRCVIDKAPSAGLFDGQTDEKEMGITYAAIDDFLLEGKGDPEEIEKIKAAHARTGHKRVLPVKYRPDDK